MRISQEELIKNCIKTYEIYCERYDYYVIKYSEPRLVEMRKNGVLGSTCTPPHQATFCAIESMTLPRRWMLNIARTKLFDSLSDFKHKVSFSEFVSEFNQSFDCNLDSSKLEILQVFQ